MKRILCVLVWVLAAGPIWAVGAQDDGRGVEPPREDAVLEGVQAASPVSDDQLSVSDDQIDEDIVVEGKQHLRGRANMAFEAYRAGRFRQAERLYREFRLAMERQLMAERANALAWWQEVLPADNIAKIYLLHGISEAELGWYGRAANTFHEALKIEPDNAQALMGYVLARAKDRQGDLSDLGDDLTRLSRVVEGCSEACEGLRAGYAHLLSMQVLGDY